MKLLFAEDTKDLNRAVTVLLAREGYTVDSAADGEEALEYIKTESYDGIILDIMMPKADGMTVLAEVRAAHSDARFAAHGKSGGGRPGGGTRCGSG